MKLSKIGFWTLFCLISASCLWSTAVRAEQDRDDNFNTTASVLLGDEPIQSSNDFLVFQSQDIEVDSRVKLPTLQLENYSDRKSDNFHDLFLEEGVVIKLQFDL